MVRFTTKRIESNTLGERMRKLREERRLTLAEISRNTNVQVKYLEYLENGEYLKLPAEVYVKGFLRNYANFMGISHDSIIRQYEREKKIDQNIKKETYGNTKEVEPIKFSKFIITPKLLVIFLGIIILVSGFAYLYRQVENFASNPRLFINRPTDGEAINERTVRVVGSAEKDAKVTINGQSVLANESGEFSEEIGLAEGLNKITISAKNKFDKESVQTISVNAEYEKTAEQSGLGEAALAEAGEEKKFFLELRVVSVPTRVSVESDGNLVYNGVLEVEATKRFEAKKEIKISSGNGKNTLVKFNGEEELSLENNSKAVRDIIFTPNGREQQ